MKEIDKINSAKPELIIFTGNIGCGKSTLASKLAKKGYVVINMDSITAMVQGGEYGLYDAAKKPVYHSMERAGIESALSNGLSVVVDRTNMKISDRAKYIEIGKKHGANIRSFDWGVGTASDLGRRLINPNGVPAKQWHDVFKYMAGSYEPPSLDEGFDSRDGGIRSYQFYAFDFDGTIVGNKFPEIGALIPSTVKKMSTVWENYGNMIIIWTCRSGDYLNQMKAFLLKEKIPFDFINENPLVDYGSPKIFAHEYYDDRNEALKK
jgi:hypothetical protein